MQEKNLTGTAEGMGAKEVDEGLLTVPEFGIEPGIYEAVIGNSTIDFPYATRSKGDKAIVRFPITVLDERFEGNEDEVGIWARRGVMEKVLKALGVEYKIGPKGVTFRPEDCLGRPCKVRFEERPGKVPGQSFVNAVDILPIETEVEKAL